MFSVGFVFWSCIFSLNFVNVCFCVNSILVALTLNNYHAWNQVNSWVQFILFNASHKDVLWSPSTKFSLCKMFYISRTLLVCEHLSRWIARMLALGKPVAIPDVVKLLWVPPNSENCNLYSRCKKRFALRNRYNGSALVTKIGDRK